MAHHHQCDGCGDSVECSAPYERNYDGIPEAVCRRVYDNQTIWCEACEEHGVCEDCGNATAGNEEFHFVCDPCAVARRDNYDPTPWEVDTAGTSAGEQMDAAYKVDRSQR